MTTRTIDPDTDLLPDEQALLDGQTIDTGATAAADDDTGTDDAALNAEALAAIAAKGEPSANTTTSDDTPADDTTAAAPAPAAPTFVVDDPAKFQETLEALQAKKAAAMKELMDGTLEPDAYAAIDNEVTQGLLKLNTNMTLHEQNVQQEQARQRAAIEAIQADGAAKGVDYNADPALMALFDAKLRTVATRDDMAGKSATEIYQATHQEVLKLFGKAGAPAPSPAPSPAPTAAATPAAPAPAPKPALPVTLGQMPNAAPVDIGADLTTTLMGMENPDDAEAMLSRMSASQRQAALRATVGTQPLRRTGANRNQPEA